MDDQQGELLLEISRQLGRTVERLDRLNHTQIELSNCTPASAIQQTTVTHSGDRVRDLMLGVSLTFAFVSLLSMLVMLALYIDNGRKLDRMQDYWTVTLQYVPGLKDQLNTNKGKPAP